MTGSLTAWLRQAGLPRGALVALVVAPGGSTAAAALSSADVWTGDADEVGAADAAYPPLRRPSRGFARASATHKERAPLTAVLAAGVFQQ